MISPSYLLNFFSNLYPTMVAETFQIYGVKITGKEICESKNWICSFLFMPPSNILLQVLITTTPGRRKLPTSREQRFLKIYFSPAERGKDYGVKKMTKIKPLKTVITSSDEFHRFWNLDIFGFCFLVPQFRFKHAEV